MEYSKAIVKLFDTYGVDIMSTPFYALSVLSDYIGNDYYGKRLSTVLFTIHPHINLIELFRKRSIKDGRKQMSLAYEQFKSKCSKSEYVDAINPISQYLRPDEFHTSRSSVASNSGSAEAVTHKQVRKQVVKPEVVKSTPVKQPVYCTPAATNQPPVKRRKRTTSKNVDYLVITAYCSSFSLIPSSVSEPELYVDGVLTKSVKPILSQGIGMYIYNFMNKDVLVKLPDRQYESISVTGSTKYAFVSSDNSRPIQTKRLNITMSCATLFINGIGESLEADLRHTRVQLMGQFNYIDGISGKGELKFDLDLPNKHDFKMAWKLDNGSITGGFNNVPNANIYKPKSHWFTSLNINKVIQNVRCTFNLKTRAGSINID